MTTPLTVLFAALLTQFGAGTDPTLQDLCALDPLLNVTGEVLSDADGVTLSRYCKWTGPEAPVWDDLACCNIDINGANCVSPDGRDSCGSGTSPYYCEHGYELPDGGLLCLQSFPSVCELGTCLPGSGLELLAPDAIQEGVLCCAGGACVNWHGIPPQECDGYYFWCHAGYTNMDGTTDCYDASTEP